MPNQTPSSVLKKIFQGNAGFVTDHQSEEFDAYQFEQHPNLTLLTCCDSRVQTNMFRSDPTDALFVIRNIGNQLTVNCGSIDYGVLQLQTPVLMVLGHTRCGAIKAAMGDFRSEPLHMVEELNGLLLPLREVAEDADNPDREWLEAVERNVHFQVDLALNRYRDRIDAGKLVVVGGVYDFANLYTAGRGRIHVVNLNGEQEPTAIRNSPLLDGIDVTTLA